MNEPARVRIGSKLLASIRTANELAQRLLVAPDDARTDIGPPLALTSDGKLLVNADFLPGALLEGRALWVGVPLDGEQLKDVHAALGEAALDVAARIARPERDGEELSDSPDEPRGPTDQNSEEDNPTPNR